MQTNLFTLSFSGEDEGLEQYFLKDYFEKSIRTMRAAFIIGMVLYAIFGALDFIFAPEIKEKLLFIRFVVILFVGLFLILSFFRNFKKYWQFAILINIIVVGLGVIGLIVIAPAPVGFSYYAGLILILCFAYTLSRIRFIWGSLAGFVIIICYEIAATLIVDTPRAILINNNFFFIGGNLLGMLAAYFNELHTRHNFYLRFLLEGEKDKVKVANQKLEEKFSELNSALDKIKTLSGFLPICAHCKRIRDDQGYWNQLEAYISTHSEAEFSHSICPDCAKKLYPEFVHESKKPPAK